MPSSPSVTPPDCPTQPLYHLGYNLPSDLPLLRPQLQGIRYVLICGTSTRARSIAERLRTGSHADLCLTSRFVLLNPTAATLVAAHGIGGPSVDTLLHELHVLLHAVGASSSYALLRVGSCGAVGHQPGTLVVTRQPVDGLFRAHHTLRAVAEELVLPARLHTGLSDALRRFAEEAGERVVVGDTLCADSFYVAQARVDGAFAMVSAEQRAQRLRLARSNGVANFEMESLAVAAFATRVGVPAAVLCAVLVDRLEGETPTEPEERLQRFVDGAVDVVVGFVRACVDGHVQWER